MYFELPDCRRCCLCVPLRHGILIFGYLNLLVALIVLGIDIWIEERLEPVSYSAFLYRGVAMYTQLWFCYLLFILEVIFNVVLVVGAHRKNTRLIRVYYYYGIVTTLASFLAYLFLDQELPDEMNKTYIFDPMLIECWLAFSGIVLQCYLLLLIRTELNKLQYQGGPVRYVNQATEVVVEPIPAGMGREEGSFVI